MESHKHIVVSPIHRPCPDMAGCANFKQELTKKSLQVVKSLREKFGLNTGRTHTGCKDFRFSRPYQVQARRALEAAKAKGGLL